MKIYPLGILALLSTSALAAPPCELREMQVIGTVLSSTVAKDGSCSTLLRINMTWDHQFCPLGSQWMRGHQVQTLLLQQHSGKCPQANDRVSGTMQSKADAAPSFDGDWDPAR